MDKGVQAMQPHVEVFGVTVADVLREEPLHRDLDVVEVFAGVRAVANAAESAGKTSEAIDRDINVKHDLTTKQGFMFMIVCIMRLAIDG